MPLRLVEVAEGGGGPGQAAEAHGEVVAVGGAEAAVGLVEHDAAGGVEGLPGA